MENEMKVGTPELNKALSKFTGALKQPELNKTVTVKTTQGGKYDFKYADLSACVAAAAKPLSENGLSVTQIIREGVLVTSLRHSSGEEIESCIPLPAMLLNGSNFQALGSAITYLKRYAFCAILGIVADTDDDANAAIGNDAVFQETQKKKEQSQKPQQAQQQPKYDGAQIKRLLAEFGTETNLQGVFTIFDKAASIGASQDKTVLEELKKTFVRVISHNVSSGAASFADIEAYFTQKNWGAYFNGIREDINKAIQEKGGAS